MVQAFMGPEDQIRRSSNTGSSSCRIEPFGRSGKRPKSKRVPQRGLGVAQLEKIRLEEQQQKDVAAVSSTTILSSSQSPTTTTHISSLLSLPIPSFSPPIQSGSSCSSTSVPFPADFSSPNVSVNSVPLLPVPGNGVNYKNWRCSEHDLEKQSSGSDPDLGFSSSFYLPHESEPLWPLPSLMRRAHQFQQSSSSMVNFASSTPPSSSLMNYQMELPSNQSYYRNVVMPLLPEEEKMVGMKRLYPFTLDNPPAPSVGHNVPPLVPSSDKSYESPWSTDGGVPSFDLGSTIFREMPPCSAPILESYTGIPLMENGVSSGDFLTLAPPTSPCKSSKLKQPSSHFTYYNQESPGFTSLPYKANLEDSNTRLGTNGLNMPRPYFSFLPSAVVQAAHGTGAMNKCNGGEMGGSVDLNLKL